MKSSPDYLEQKQGNENTVWLYSNTWKSLNVGFSYLLLLVKIYIFDRVICTAIVKIFFSLSKEFVKIYLAWFAQQDVWPLLRL
jgi:hypothetical protein